MSSCNTIELAQALGLPLSQVTAAIEAAEKDYARGASGFFGGGVQSVGSHTFTNTPAAAPAPSTPAVATATLTPTVYDYNELDNSRRFLDQCGKDLRFVADAGKSGQWLIWTGQRWEYDPSEAIVTQRAAGAVQTLALEIANATTAAKRTKDKEIKSALEQKARTLTAFRDKSLSHRSLKALVALASTDPSVRVLSVELDADPMLLGVKNGVVDLKTGQLILATREQLITRCAGTHFDPKAKAPNWEQHISLITRGNAGMADYLQKAIGYSLTGSVVQEKMFQLVGNGTNGKSKFTGPMLKVFGTYGQKAPVAMLYDTKKDSSGPNSAHARMHGVRFALMSEAKSTPVNEGFLKELTSTEEQVARGLYVNESEFRPTHHVWLTSNVPLLILGTDDGIWRRIDTLPFKHSFTGADRDEHIEAKLLAELPGILAWAVRGCLDYQSEGLRLPTDLQDYNAEHRARLDSLGTFIAEEAITGGKYKAKIADVYAAYCKYAEERGEMPPKMRIISERLERKGYEIRKSSVMTVYGLGLLADPATQALANVKPIQGQLYARSGK